MEQTGNKRLIISHVEKLCTSIGSRPAVSPNNQAAQQYIEQQFRQMGLLVETQAFDGIHWEAGPVTLRVNHKLIPAAPSPYSLPADFTGKFEIAETLEQLQELELKNKAVLLTGELTKEPLMPKNFRFWNPEHHQQIIKVLETASPKVILTAVGMVPSFVLEDGDFNVPSVALPKKYLTHFLNGPKDLEVSFEATRFPSKGANVIARLNPRSASKVVCCAHFDTKPGTPGALDNASGIATLLLTASLLRKTKVDHCIEFIAFNGEDYFSTPGQVTYLEKSRADFDQIILAINCDGVGYKEGKTGISPISCSEATTQLLERHLLKYPSLTLSKPWYQGDHMLFVGAGVPALAITSQEIFGIMDTIIHSEKDTPALVDPGKIQATSMLLADVITEL